MEAKNVLETALDSQNGVDRGSLKLFESKDIRRYRSSQLILFQVHQKS